MREKLVGLNPICGTVPIRDWAGFLKHFGPVESALVRRLCV